MLSPDVIELNVGNQFCKSPPSFLLQICSRTIEIIDIECVLGNLAGTQIEKKIALINPPCWICPRSGLCELQWGEFNLPL